MPNMVHPVTSTGDIAVKLADVTKQYIQWQRSGQFKAILKNLIHPQQKIITALDHATLQVKKGEFVAYAGANGAGKSTTIKLLAGLLQPTSGEIRVLGLDPARCRIELMRQLGIVFGQRTELWWDQPLEVSFEWKQVVWDIPKNTYRHTRQEIIDLLDLGELMHTFARELSLGQRMRADLGLMLLHQPKLILLDEPTLGLDVLAKQQMITFLKRINREQKTTIIVTSHDMDDLEEMAQRIILLSHGGIAFDGDFEQLRQLSGKMRRITLTTRSVIAPALAAATLVTSNQTIHGYEYDTNQVTVKQLLAEIAKLPDIVDIETGKAPIEEVIAGLYRQWRG